jgi:FtsH-binding integral membrane protein
VFINSGNGHLIAFALALTVGIFGALSWYVHETKEDFSFMGGFLFSALLILVFAGFIGIFFLGTINRLIYSSVGLVLFCGFVLYDTSRIILKYDVEEYVAATLDLYLDFLNIFADILRILFETADETDFFP